MTSESVLLRVWGGQAVFNAVLGPQILRDFSEDAPSARLHGLSQDRFPSWCAGPCGCIGKRQVRHGAWSSPSQRPRGLLVSRCLYRGAGAVR